MVREGGNSPFLKNFEKKNFEKKSSSVLRNEETKLYLRVGIYAFAFIPSRMSCNNVAIKTPLRYSVCTHV
jgi:hypothetical protein